MPTSSWRRRLALAVLPALLVPAGCQDAEPASQAVPTSPAPATPSGVPSTSAGPAVAADPARQAAALVATLDDESLVGQVLMPFAYGTSATDVSPGSRTANRAYAGAETPAEIVAKYRLGGVILVGGASDEPTGANQPAANVDNPRQVRDLTDGLQKAAAAQPTGPLPLLIGTDQEYGVVVRVRGEMTALPSAMAFGAAANPTLTEAAWKVAGTELAAIGVNVNFAPVADVLGPRGSAVIGSRAYGTDPSAVGAQVDAAVRGLRAGGVAATLKHFPGHGHTTGDSHDGLPRVGQSRAALDREDLPPFTAGIAAGAELVMSGHLDVRAVHAGVAATFSRTVMTDLLRKRLKFTGVAVTDALNMAPAKRWPPGEAAVRALNAGNDLLLMPPDLIAARDGLLAALRDRTLPRARLLEAATRVLTLRHKLATRPPGDVSVVGTSAHAAVVRRLSTAAVTVLRGPCKGRPLVGPVTVTASGGREPARVALVRALRDAGVPVVASGGTVVHLVGYGDGRTDLRSGAAATVAMDNPAILGASSAKLLLAAYSSSPLSMAGVADVLAGRVAPAGRSPVAVRGLPRSACRR